ncbi:MAG: triose-phosphate isomerase [Candidatus Onthovivens sp.]|nr:triose-phosphate isomerase [Mollicutes bacterium]MDY4857642.1 triose-phosphate isomerase [Candidatus Onthovivens sp.]MDY4936693.1 triose-phosphate isomerase [Candidatus Onthovivens sp.]
MRRKLLLGNWKMNKTVSEAKEFALNAKDLGKLAKQNKVDMGICVPYIDLAPVKKILKNSLIVGAENCHELDHGAYTGEVSIPMLLDLGITWCIIGHSERRTYYNETSEACNKKILALLKNNMVPVYCCGESLETYEEGKTKEFVKEQIIKGFKDVSKEDAAKVVIAYEPIWSIGTGKNASKEIAEDVCKFIRKTIKDLYDTKTSNKVRILYGGSVKPNNIKEYLYCDNIDGALVGGASLDVNSYKELLTNLL